MQRIVRSFAVAIALVLFLPFTASASNDPFFPEQWGLATIGAEAAWSQGRGGGTVIAVIDTGVDLNHEDLSGKIMPGRSFVGNSVQDDNGHGTHVSGIAAAATGNSTGVAGVAPDARILPIKVLNGDGVGTVTDVAAGIRFAADSGADVINLSFGEASTSVDLAPNFTDAIRYAWSKGSIPVVASGNDFVRSSNFTSEPVIVVTASSRTDTRPSYASGVGGAQWGLAAPGGDGSTCVPETGIVSTYAQNSYACLVGTSMSVPHVSGAAAVLRGLGMSPAQAVAQLLSTADDLGAPGVDTTFGSGRLNLARAVQAAAAPVPSTTAPPPAPTTVAPPTIAATPPPATAPPATTTPSPPTTEAPVTTVTPPPTTEAPTMSLPTNPAVPVEVPGGQAVALLPESDDTTRYIAAVPAGLLVVAMGLASFRMRRQLPWR